MSLFQTETLPCPSCGGGVIFELVHSVNVDRRPDYRDDILDESFQKKTCGGCRLAFRMEPEFTYLDIGRKMWIAAMPSGQRDSWSTRESTVFETFEKAFGSKAPGAAQFVGEGLAPRITFGWPALREKIVANEAGIDDRTLEVAKAGMIRNLDAAPLATHALRLFEVREDEAVLGWFDDTDTCTELALVSPAVFAEVEASRDAWEALYSDMEGGIFVDMARLLVESA